MRESRRLVFVLLTFLTLVACQAGQSGEVIQLANITVVDVKDGKVLSGMTVVIEGGRITSVAANATAPDNRGLRVDGTGKFLIPGLWDMHVHLVHGDWFPRARDILLPLFVANGVTGVRDMGSEIEPVLEWRREIEAGKRIGPRIVTSGPMLDGPPLQWPSSVTVATPADGRRVVRDVKQRGADFIKLHSRIPRDAFFAIADEATQQGMTFAGHVPDAVRASEASSAGQKSFEHLLGIFEGSSPEEDKFLTGVKSPGKLLATYDPDRAQSLFALLAKNHTWQCPVLIWERGFYVIEERDFARDPLAKYAPESWKGGSWRRFTDRILHEFNVDDLATRKRFVQKELEVAQGLHQAGVPFLAGTDTPSGVFVFPGFSLHDELEIFVRAGFTPREALETATVNPAIFFGRERDLGTVEVGKSADLLLLEANPLDDIRNTRKIAGVVLQGRYLSRGDLDELLGQAEAAAK